MNIAVVGSREFNNYQYMKSILDVYHKAGELEKIITGDARGADTLALKYAKEHDIPCHQFFAEWDKYGKSAGPLRNERVVSHCDMIIAFRVDGLKNKGTNNAIEKAENKGKDVIICDYKPDEFEEIG